MNMKTIELRAIARSCRLPLACVALVTGLLSGGCGRSQRAEERDAAIFSVRLQTLPPFLNHPVSVLLTNTPGFGAYVVMETRWSSNQVGRVSGQLLGMGSKFLFEPEAINPSGKPGRAGGVLFIWDVAKRSGYVLNDPLQGYAPIGEGGGLNQVTVQASSRQPVAERVEGHKCEQEDESVTWSDQTRTDFHVLRSLDQKGFPIRVTWTTNDTTFTLSFSKVLFEPPAAELFEPPDGFTKYASQDAMISELMMRQQGVKRPAMEGSDRLDNAGEHEGRRYRGQP